eukprot:scaffold55248_cov65-Attheya_sp.AAC.4
MSDIIIKNLEQANNTLERCTAFNLASPDIYSISPFMQSFLPHKHGIFSRSNAKKRDSRCSPRKPRDADSIDSHSTCGSAIPPSIQHNSIHVPDPTVIRDQDLDHELHHHDTTLVPPESNRRSSRIPPNAHTLVPHPLICQTTVDVFDHTAYYKTKGEECSDFIHNWINEVIMNLANTEHETFRALFCLTNPQAYGYLLQKP